jgi:hypothetical protein
MGVVPGIFLRPMEPAVTKVIERVTSAQPVRVSNRTTNELVSGKRPHSSAQALREPRAREPRTAKRERRAAN